MAGRRRQPPASSSPVSATPAPSGELTTWSPNLFSNVTTRIPFQFVQASTERDTNEFTTWSPRQLKDSIKRIPRRFVKVPLDQTKALEDATIWGRSHVIPKVLEEAEARISRETTRPRDGLSSQPQPQEVPSSQPASPFSRTRTAHQAAMSATEQEHGDEYEEDEKRTIVSWPSSPPNHFRDPRYRSVPQPQLQSAWLVEFAPGSSQPSETGVEVEPPNPIIAQSQGRPVLVPLAVSAPQDPTPPSAQTIPATLPRVESPSPEPAVKRRRLMKDISSLLDSPGRSERRPSSTFAADKSADHMLAAPSGSTSPITSTPIVPRNRCSPTLADQMKIITATPANVRQPESSRSSDKPPPNKTHSQDPFNMFCEEYPDYGGSLNTFIRATISLEEQQRVMLLNEFLYDDYVRVFSGPYLEYIESCLEDGVSKPLTTIQWYNRNVKVPVYMNRHLTEGRVKEILKYYPGMVHEIREQARGAAGSSTAKKGQGTTTQVVKDTPRHQRPIQRAAPAAEMTRSLPNRPSPRKTGPVIVDLEAETPIHRAELASDPICIAEDFSPVTKSRYKATRKLAATPSFRSSGTGPARQVSGEDIESTDPLNRRNSPALPTMTSPGFETQVAHQSLDIQSSVPAVIEDTTIIDDDVQEVIEVHEGEAEGHSQQPGVDKQPSQRIGVKRPWEAIEDPEVRAELQLKYWEVFLEKVYMPSRMLFFGQAEEEAAK
ncbi:hypothetical protein QBC44DRAFT_300466 [Cladorrhinum sp. PSN332]|nr:hypothetical protein QBC44DRAFT_300466 [Cladorrhinum sp. PSN332]